MLDFYASQPRSFPAVRLWIRHWHVRHDRAVKVPSIGTGAERLARAHTCRRDPTGQAHHAMGSGVRQAVLGTTSAAYK